MVNLKAIEKHTVVKASYTCNAARVNSASVSWFSCWLVQSSETRKRITTSLFCSTWHSDLRLVTSCFVQLVIPQFISGTPVPPQQPKQAPPMKTSIQLLPGCKETGTSVWDCSRHSPSWQFTRPGPYTAHLAGIKMAQ